MSIQYILHNSIDLLYVTADADGNIVFANDLFKEYTSHIQPKTISDFIPDNVDMDEMVAAIEKAKKTPYDAVRVYVKIKQKNQTLRWNLFNVYFILNSIHLVGFPILDVTSITNHEFEKQKTLLEDLRFMLSHEIRQPLTAIAGLVDMMLQNTQTEINNTDLLKMMKDSAKRLDEAIQRIVKKSTRQL
jgi:nitrogen-specific signal transduction histidine kinase